MRTLKFICIFILFNIVTLTSTAQTTDTVLISSETIEYKNIIIKKQLNFSLENWQDSLYAKDVTFKIKLKSDVNFNLNIYVYDENFVPFIYKDFGRKRGGVYEINFKINFYTNGTYYYEIQL
jgi:hypothetical protein